jgi:hypothetical protein
MSAAQRWCDVTGCLFNFAQTASSFWLTVKALRGLHAAYCAKASSK